VIDGEIVAFDRDVAERSKRFHERKYQISEQSVDVVHQRCGGTGWQVVDRD